MSGLQIVIEIVLIGLLGGTLLHALRLQRAVGRIKQDRAELEQLILGFDESNRQAEAGAERLRIAADLAGRAMSRQVDGASNLKDELADLIERGERLAARLGSATRDREPPAVLRRPSLPEQEMVETAPRVRSQAEQDLLRALRVTR